MPVPCAPPGLLRLGTSRCTCGHTQRRSHTRVPTAPRRLPWLKSLLGTCEPIPERGHMPAPCAQPGFRAAQAQSATPEPIPEKSRTPAPCARPAFPGLVISTDTRVSTPRRGSTIWATPAARPRCRRHIPCQVETMHAIWVVVCFPRTPSEFIVYFRWQLCT